MAGLTDHLLSIPPVTRFFLIVTIGVSLGISLDILSPEKLMLPSQIGLGVPAKLVSGASAKWHYVDALRRLLPQSYRVFTAFFVVDGVKDNGVRVLLNIYRFYTFSNYLENSRGRFQGNFPDYFWFVLVSGAFLLVINAVFGYFGYATLFLLLQLLSCMTFLWLRTSMNSVINFLGIVPIKAYYLPLFDLGLAVMLGGPQPADSFAGILAGYTYECIQSDTLPFYNLLPGAYGVRPGGSQNDGRRVGFNVDTSILPTVFSPAVFDLGYWKAPAFFYRLLKYPINTSVRTTAFSLLQNIHALVNVAKTREKSHVSESQSNFRGKGHRLGT